MPRTVKLACLLLAVGLLGSDTAFSQGFVFANIGTLFSWNNGVVQTTWKGSPVAVSVDDFESKVANNGSCVGTSGTLMAQSKAIACASNPPAVTGHSPLVTNNTFAGGSFSGWSTANVGGCSGSLFSASSVMDQDGDSGLASASSSICAGTPAQVTLSQTFNTGGAPTSQTYSFWYRGTQASSECEGNTNTGSVSLKLQLNGTTVANIVNPNLDNSWHQVNGSTGALVNGSNTFLLTATLVGAVNQRLKYVQGDTICINSGFVAQAIQIDNIVLSGSW